VSLFNHGLYHECHDALEPIWDRASGELKNQLQGLILLAAGYHHLQLHNLSGLRAVWKEGLERLRACGGRVATPWGEVRAEAALDLTALRLEDGSRNMDEAATFGALWALDRPTWELA
jgi:predicted metal-dependent hydrolase